MRDTQYWDQLVQRITERQYRQYRQYRPKMTILLAYFQSQSQIATEYICMSINLLELESSLYYVWVHNSKSVYLDLFFMYNPQVNVTNVWLRLLFITVFLVVAATACILLHQPVLLLLQISFLLIFTASDGVCPDWKSRVGCHAPQIRKLFQEDGQCV